MGLQGACTPALGRHCQRDVEGLPGQRLAGPCLPPAHQRGAGRPRAGGLKGLARFRFLVQEILCQRDRRSLPGIWGAAVCNPLGARRDAGQPGAEGIRGTPWDLGPSSWETPQKRLKRFARGLAGWPLPPTGASGGCRGTRGAPRGLRPSSGEIWTKTWGGPPGPRCARWAALCIAPAHLRGARWPGASGLGGACLVWGPSSGDTPSKRLGRSARDTWSCHQGPDSGLVGCRAGRSWESWGSPQGL